MGKKTSKRAVQVYLSKEMEEYIEQYCKTHNLLQTNPSGIKVPRMATGISKILEHVYALK